MTVPSSERPEAERLEKVVTELRREGWTVTIHPAAKELPPQLAKVSPDFFAVRGDEAVVGEVASRHSKSQSRLLEIADAIQPLSNTRFEVYWIGETSADIPQSPILVSQLGERVERVAAVDTDAALVMAFAALEASIRDYGNAEDLPDLGTSTSQQITYLYSIGLLTDRQYRQLRQLFNLRNRIVHGVPVGEDRETRLRFPYSSAEGWEIIVSFALQLANGTWTPIDVMLDRFRAEYESPTESVPHDSSEGGFQYFNGGPYHADDILREEYPSATDADIEEAVGILEDESYEWVRRDQY